MAEFISKETSIGKKKSFDSVTPTDSDANPLCDSKVSFILNNPDLNVGTNLTNKPSGTDNPMSQAANQDTSTSDLQTALLSLNIDQKEVEMIIKEGGNFLEKPKILARKLKITQEVANKALEIFKSHKEVIKMTPELCKVVKKCLEKNPDIDDPEDIALICDVDKKIAQKYFEMLPLNREQEKLIREEYRMGNSADKISKFLNISIRKVKEYIALTFPTFSDSKGKLTLEIINKYCGNISISTLQKKISSKNLKLRNQLCSDLCRKNATEYTIVCNYLSRFKETEDFLKIDRNLTLGEINVIKQSSKCLNVEELSIKLNKIESVITEYIDQYTVHPVEHKWNTELQEKQIENISKAFENATFSLTDYKTIITHSFDSIINGIKNRKKTKKVQKLMDKLLHLIFYYIKCSLPLEDIIQIITNVSNIPLTTHDMFHIIFQLSDSVLRGICIEDYSFSNPVPLYYPRLKPPQSKFKRVEYEICKELWYCLEQYNGLISFGLGRASWNAVGKSTLLDLIFKTDFVKGSPQSSAFHFRSIDIQLTRNLFGGINKSNLESIKWAYIDCHGYSDFSVIQVMCSHLDVALIHVCYNDYKNNEDALNCQLTMLKLKHAYIFLRDCDCETVTIEHSLLNGTDLTYIFVPDLTNNYISVINSLKSIGYEILHLNIRKPQFIHSQFIYVMIQLLNDPVAEDIRKENELIENITEKLNERNELDFSYLNYYPLFVEYMSAYHQASHVLDQDAVDALNSTCKLLDKKLKDTKIGDFVMFFNNILLRPKSILIMYKLSRELSRVYFSKLKTEVFPGNVQKKDKYTLEILWRETLLSYKCNAFNEHDYQMFTSNYSKHVESGEAFELIDGDNLRFFNKEIDVLLSQHYMKQTNLLDQINRDKTTKIKPTPIVVSILGPQSSGKSTLLNYCFGCKFLTSAGRCTRGIYGSLSRLDRPVNLSQSFLILDTEGLDAIERDNIKDTSMIHFDRTMVLFCLSVSQVVIINVKGDIGNEMLNILQICAYSLNRLKVSKAKAPKIFFVLNQQADPDPNKHLDAINILMEKLYSESGLMETEGVKISDLIQVSRENLLILPSAFNSENLNKPSAKLFDSDVIKLSPTIGFFDKCTNLRLAIIDQLDHMPIDDRAPFENMSEWMEMAGIIWDTIIKYQDIVKYRNLEELKCSSKLDIIVADLMEKHFYNHQDEFIALTNTLCKEVKSVQSDIPLSILFTENMIKFDEVFGKYQKSCLDEFVIIRQKDSLLKKMERSCSERKLNIERLIYAVRKRFEDHLRLEINSVLTEIKLSESKKRIIAFLENIFQNESECLNQTLNKQEINFEQIWSQTFTIEESEEEKLERDDTFSNLYSIFRIEYNSMELKQTILEIFGSHDYDSDEIIRSVKKYIQKGFLDRQSKNSEQFIYPLNSYHATIKDMIPYNGKVNYEYLCQKSLYEIETTSKRNINLIFLNWIPHECHDLLEYCSGLYSHPDIIWEPNKATQINYLKSVLKDPYNLEVSTWDKFISDISNDALRLLESSGDVSPAVVKQIIHALCSRIKLMNHEIGFIGAGLSDHAERKLSILIFSYAFKYVWGKAVEIRRKNVKKRNSEKLINFRFFKNKIEKQKMALGKWNRKWMAESDQVTSKRYCLDYIESVKRELLTSEKQNLRNLFDSTCIKESVSHERLLFLAYDMANIELSKNKGVEITDPNNAIIQYVCNIPEVLNDLFKKEWKKIEHILCQNISRNMTRNIQNKISNLIKVIEDLFQDLDNNRKMIFNSDNFFEFIEQEYPECSEIKKIPFKAMNTYFSKYLNPSVTVSEFNKFLLEVFEIDGIKVQACKNYTLPCKHSKDILDVDSYCKLVKTEIFNDGELIFNIYEYIRNFQLVLKEYVFELREDEFQEMIAPLKGEFKKKMISCPSQCPSCGKFCEREIHTNNGKCQIKTGHQISSMGGKVWNADKDNTAVLFMCDDYKDHNKVILPCGEKNWEDFRDLFGSEWDWDVPNDEKYRLKQQANQRFMKCIWNKFGRGILKYHNEKHSTNISYVPYTSYEEVNEPLLPINYYICFVIDGTGSMNLDITRVRVSVRQLISSFISQGNSAQFRVVIYRDHCDDEILETFPIGNEFTPDHNTVENFLNVVIATGGGDFPEAVLDGLATAATQSEWRCAPGFRNKIIHIFDAPPHGDFPNYTEHSSYSNKGNCCCCNRTTQCDFNWRTDVWDMFKRFNIEYHAINTTPRQNEFDSYRYFRKSIKKIVMECYHRIDIDSIYSRYEAKMREELGDLCGNFQVVGKEVVNDAILKIFVDYK